VNDEPLWSSCQQTCCYSHHRYDIATEGSAYDDDDDDDDNDDDGDDDDDGCQSKRPQSKTAPVQNVPTFGQNGPKRKKNRLKRPHRRISL